MKKRICLIYNFAQHYRTGIFRLMDQELNVRFYFGDKLGDIKKMDYSQLSNFTELRNIVIKDPLYFQSGAISLLFKNFSSYIVLGEYHCLSTWILLLLSKFTKKKVYLWTHGYYGNESSLKAIVKRFFFSLADGILLYGDYAKELMIKDGFDSTMLMVLYNSLDYKNQLMIRNTLKPSGTYTVHFDNQDPVLVFIGRLTHGKRLDLLVRSAALLRNNGVNVNLVFVGTGGAEESLKNLIEENNIENSWFYGECYDESTISRLIFDADICVSPGNVGLTAMHSMMYGTPVITHSTFSMQNPEFEAIISGVTGDFFIKDDVKDLARTIQHWLRRNDSRESIRLKCFEVIDRYYNPDFQIKVIKRIIE